MSFSVTPFASRVYAVVSRIPAGFVMTYGDVAQAIGSPRAMRAVGSALAKNPYIPTVPCHRVVRADGVIGQYLHGTEKKVSLLLEEGVVVSHRKVDLSRYRYLL